jgi:GDP-4-dehydro-6-deoxy-D-mannose reductase
MKVLITGITGMIGSQFAFKCRELEWETFGIARNSAASRLADNDFEGLIRTDILDIDALESVFVKIRPDIVLHFAAQAFNGISWQIEQITHITNYLGTLNILKVCRKVVPEAKVLIACSSAEYGDIKPEDCPLKEQRLLKPITPYGVSKVADENLGYQYYSNYKMKIFLPRLFIHVGTGHPPATAIQNFACQVARIKKGRSEPVIYVGNLETARDFIDVRDGVDAMMLLLLKGNPGEPVNICTGTAYKISDVLKMFIDISGVKLEIRQSSDLLRPSDEALLLGDNSKIIALGWKQKFTLKETLENVYNDWLKRV